VSFMVSERRAADGLIDAYGVLSNLELLERASYSTASFWAAAQLDPGAIPPGTMRKPGASPVHRAASSPSAKKMLCSE
jgi:hypothetical protein